MRGQVSCPNLDPSSPKRFWEKRNRERKGKNEKGRDFSERDSNFSLNVPAIGSRFLARQEVKFLPTVRATRGYWFYGVSTTLGGRGFLLLGLFSV